MRNRFSYLNFIPVFLNRYLFTFSQPNISYNLWIVVKSCIGIVCCRFHLLGATRCQYLEYPLPHCRGTPWRQTPLGQVSFRETPWRHTLWRQTSLVVDPHPPCEQNDWQAPLKHKYLRYFLHRRFLRCLDTEVYPADFPDTRCQQQLSIDPIRLFDIHVFRFWTLLSSLRICRTQ